MLDGRERGWVPAAVGMLLASTDSYFVRRADFDAWTIAFVFAVTSTPALGRISIVRVAAESTCRRRGRAVHHPSTGPNETSRFACVHDFYDLHMELRWPTIEMLESYAAALRTGWSPNTMRAEAAQEELEEIAHDPVAFVASLVDREAAGPPIKQPDGSFTLRLPGYRKWMWDGEFAGTVNFRWQPGTDGLPDHVPGHIGYSVVPWKRRKGYATAGVAAILDDARREGLRAVEITTDHDNLGSQRVIEHNGGVRVGPFTKQFGTHEVPGVRYRIDLCGRPSGRPPD